MSLYDKYFSKINKNHMYELIIQTVQKETGENIENNAKYLQIYRNQYPIIFEKINTDTIIDLNKELLDTVCDRIIKDIYQKHQKQDIQIVPEKETLLQDKEPQKMLIIDSSKRIKGNRYDYTVKLPFKIETCRIDEIKIPYEKNTLFINPAIYLDINDTLLYCSLQEKKQFNHREYMVYKPSFETNINIHSEEVRIRLLNHLEMNETNICDKYSIQKMKEINYHNQEIMCLSLHNKDHDILEEDSIAFLKGNQIKYVSGIIGTKDNYLLFRKLHNYQAMDYELMNLSLQNTIQIIH